jgi:hypothetical protein
MREDNIESEQDLNLLSVVQMYSKEFLIDINLQNKLLFIQLFDKRGRVYRR